ncbi:transposase [Pseudanabaena minima]|uniref:transposase n=1 Tax=Pseudanabaena minima TaxID=890415 RepID=UPI003DA97E4C
MYRQSPTGQLSFENFYLPFGGKLSGENRWVRLAELVPWEQFENEYAAQFSQGQGAPAKPFRMALGALIIKEKLGTSDEETVEQIRENPYLQYFLGLSEYRDKAPFEASMMVHFRKRLNLEIGGRINERIVKPPKESGQKEIVEKQDKKEEKKEDKKEKLEEQNIEKEQKEPEPANQGKLLLNATVAPSDIRYPTDIKLLNEAREQTEIVIDALYKQVKEQLAKKPRTYRRITQPHVRPMVRGKAGTPVEFGAKLSVSCVDGHAFLDHLSWDNFNESGDLQQQVALFKSRFGHYPAAVYVDQIYRTRSNRAYCRNLGIRITAPPLGRPVPDDLAAIRKQTLDDAKVRNQIEGKFGQAKRRFSLNRVMSKLANTSETAIAITFLVMNLDALLKRIIFFGFSWFLFCWQLFVLPSRKPLFNFNSFSWQFPCRHSKYYPLPLCTLRSP